MESISNCFDDKFPRLEKPTPVRLEPKRLAALVLVEQPDDHAHVAPALEIQAPVDTKPHDENISCNDIFSSCGLVSRT